MEAGSVTVVVKQVEEDKSIAVVHIFPLAGVSEVLYVVKGDKWEDLKAKLVVGESVEVTIVDVKGNSAIAKIGDKETSSKGLVLPPKSYMY